MSLIHYEKDFNELIKEKAVVDFYANWCGPCKMFSPIFEKVATNQEINFVKINVDESSDIARENGVMSIPTIICFKNGKEEKRHTGFMSEEELINFISE